MAALEAFLWWLGHSSAPFTSSWCGCESGPVLEELESPLVLGDLEQLLGALLIEGKAARPLNHVLRELGMVGEVLVAVGCQLAHVLGCLVALVKTQGHGVVKSYGCFSSMAVVAEGPYLGFEESFP